MGILSVTNSPGGLGQSPKSLSIDHELSASFLSNISGGAGLFLKQQVSRNQRVIVLDHLNKLLELVKYGKKNMVEIYYHLIVIIIDYIL